MLISDYGINPLPHPELHKLSYFSKLSKPKPGWDKIFYFVGANTFSRKLRPKQLESDATKDAQNSGNFGIPVA